LQLSVYPRLDTDAGTLLNDSLFTGVSYLVNVADDNTTVLRKFVKTEAKVLKSDEATLIIF